MKKRATVETREKKDTHLFHGETMKCEVCKKEQKSDPKKESNWTAIQADDRPPIYICPDCWFKLMGVKL